MKELSKWPTSPKMRTSVSLLDRPFLAHIQVGGTMTDTSSCLCNPLHNISSHFRNLCHPIHLYQVYFPPNIPSALQWTHFILGNPLSQNIQPYHPYLPSQLQLPQMQSGTQGRQRPNHEPRPGGEVFCCVFLLRNTEMSIPSLYFSGRRCCWGSKTWLLCRYWYILGGLPSPCYHLYG